MTEDRSQKVLFTPSNPTTASALEEQLGKLTGSPPPTSTEPAAECPAESQFYCEHIYAAANMALRKGKLVLIVGEPYISDRHIVQQSSLENMLRARFSGQPNVRYLNLGRTVDLRDKSLCWDGMHLTEAGNRRIATALVQPTLNLLHQ